MIQIPSEQFFYDHLDRKTTQDVANITIYIISRLITS